MGRIERLVRDLGVSPDQAAGAAGLLLQIAQARLPEGDFLRVADAIPAVSDIIAKSPFPEPPIGSSWRATLSRWLGGRGDLAGVAQGFCQLGIDTETLPLFVATLREFFQEQAGPDSAELLKRVLR